MRKNVALSQVSSFAVYRENREACMTRRMQRRQFLQVLVGGLAVAPINWVDIVPRALADDASRSSFSRESYEQARQAVPVDELREPARSKVLAVLQQPTIYRRLPVQVIDCDPELFLFLVRNPEIVVNIWQLMGITRVKLQRVAPYTFDADDGAGTRSTVELLYGSRDKHLLYASGYYEGPLFKRRVNGRCVLLLQTGFSESADLRTLVSSRLDIFVALDNVGAELVAKTLHPLVGKTADHNFSETMEFIAQVSQQAEHNPAGMQRLASRLTGVSASLRQQFATVSTEVNQRAALRVAALPMAPPSSPPSP